MDFITITQLKIFAHHGVLEEEKKNGQDFFLNVKLYLDCAKAGKNDNLKDALNYADACQFMTETFQQKSYDLIEAAAEHLCQELLLHYEALSKVELELCKPHAPIGLPFENVSISMMRQWHKVYLSFGSNMGDRNAYVEQGIQELKDNIAIRNVRVSKLLETEPYGYVNQETFLNGCLFLETWMGEEELLAFLHEVEAHANRKRVVVWGPRTLDMDIIFYDKETYESENLIIPHVDMENRLFVLAPLCELCPNYRHPILKKTVKQLLTKVERETINKAEEQQKEVEQNNKNYKKK